MKKMKQARLPFKVLSPRGSQQAEPTGLTALPASLKKRKLSDTAPGPIKASKNPRSDENQTKLKKPAITSGGKKVDDAENEVSSSSEADSGQHKNKLLDCFVKIEKKSGIMDMFVRTTQQLEVSTTNGQVDSTGINEEYIEDSSCMDKGDSSPNNHIMESDVVVIDDNSQENEDHGSVTVKCDSTKPDECKGDDSKTMKKNELKDKTDCKISYDENEAKSEQAPVESTEGTNVVPSKNSHKETDSKCKNVCPVIAEEEPEAKIDPTEKACEKTNEMSRGSEVTLSEKQDSEPSQLKSDDEDDLKENEDDEENLDESLKECETTDISISSQDDSINDKTLNDSLDDDALKSPSSSSGEHRETLTSPNTGENSSAKTPLSGKKLAEREEKRVQREAEKEERRLKKLKELEDKKIQKQEEKDKRDREREEVRKQKEQEKKDKLEQKEKERLEKLKQKEEEKRKKEEERQKKEEERQKKVEEKKKEVEEKQRLKEEEKEKKLKEEQEVKIKGNKVSEKQKTLFTSFFTKKERDAAKREDCESGSGLFMQFPVKSDMRLAPVTRVDIASKAEQLDELDQVMPNQDCRELYLQQLKGRTLIPGRGTKTWPRDDRDVMIVEEDNKPDCKSMKAKYFLFHENYRPPYYGTWSKSSNKITPRNPMGKDQDFLDYDVDSDDEWEEEEPGESLSDSGGEEEEGEAEKAADNSDDEDEDGFFVPHGYLSEGEGCDDDDEDVTPDRLKARQLARAKAFEIDMKKKTELLRPIAIGCCWWQPQESQDPAHAMLSKFQCVPFQAFPIDLALQRSDEASEKQRKKKQNKEDRKNPQLLAVPDQAMCDLIRLVHGNMCGVQKLIREFREYWRLKDLGIDPAVYKREKEEAAALAASSGGSQDPEDTAENIGEADTSQNDSLVKEGTKYSISKRQLDKTIKEMASYEKRPSFKRLCWYVNDSVLEKYNLKDLAISTEWTWVTKEPRKIVVKSAANFETSTPVEGRSPTPTQILPNKEGNIMKFAKPGISPKFPVLSPKPIKPIVAVLTPKSMKGFVRTTTSPGMLKSPSLCSTPKGCDTPKRMGIKAKVTPGGLFKPPTAAVSMEVSDDTDCAIVDVELNPAENELPKLDKNQPTLLSMFSATGAKSTSKTVAKGSSKVVVKKPSEISSADVIISAKSPQIANKSPASAKPCTSGKKLANILAVINTVAAGKEEVVSSSGNNEENKESEQVVGSAECPMEID